MIRVFLHVAGMNHYREIIAELAGQILGSGLYDAASTLTAVCSSEANVDGIFGDKWEIEHSHEGIEGHEFPTLRTLWERCKNDPSGIVLYMHTKGASRPDKRRHRDAWRHYMTHFLVDRWQETTRWLDIHDCCGNDWTLNRNSMASHFCGNFWWANAKYIATLDDPYSMKTRDPKGERYGAEIWIGSRPDCNHKEVFVCNAPLYLHRPNPIPDSSFRGM